MALPMVRTQGPGTKVSDEISDQLHRDNSQAEAREMEYRNIVADEIQAESRVKEFGRSEHSSGCLPGHDESEKKRREQERILREILRRKREAAELERRKERQAQQKPRKMGVCCMGFPWIRQSTGYRCAGSSHFVSNEQLGAGPG